VTALEGVTLEKVLQGTLHPPGRQIEDLGPEEIARVMVAIQRMRRDKIEEIKLLACDVADAVKIATVIRAREHLDHAGPQDECAQAGKLAAAEAVFHAETLKAELEAARESLRLLKDDWDTCRSVNANSRAERNAIEGYGA
jgi:hypothetical protein